jgi:hypothetical protein
VTTATFDEWTSAFNAAAAEPGWHEGMRALHDARRMARVPSPAEAQSRGLFLQRRAKAIGIQRWAVVVPENIAKRDAYWLASVFADRDGAWCRMFTDIDEAEAWVRADAA